MMNNRLIKKPVFSYHYDAAVVGKPARRPIVGTVRKDGKMALFKRPDLEAQGLTKEQIEYIMTESGRSLSANYTLNSDVQTRIDEAVKAVKPEPVDVKTAPEYVAVVRERDMLRTIGGEEFQNVKPKFRETVFDMLDRGEKAAAIPDQLTGIREKYEEYFIQEKQPDPDQKNTPQYSREPGRPNINPESEEEKLAKQLSATW